MRVNLLSCIILCFGIGPFEIDRLPSRFAGVQNKPKPVRVVRVIDGDNDRGLQESGNRSASGSSALTVPSLPDGESRSSSSAKRLRLLRGRCWMISLSISNSTRRGTRSIATAGPLSTGSRIGSGSIERSSPEAMGLL